MKYLRRLARAILRLYGPQRDGQRLDRLTPWAQNWAIDGLVRFTDLEEKEARELVRLREAVRVRIPEVDEHYGE